MDTNKALSFIIGALIALAVALGFAMGAAAVDLCPQSDPWVKVDNLQSSTFTYVAPAGYLIQRTCYKAATTVVYADIDPPASEVSLVSTVENENGRIQDLSHASFFMIPIPTEEPTPDPDPTREPPVTEEPTNEPTPTPDSEPEVTPTPTTMAIEPTPTAPCKAKRLGMLFTLIGPDGQVGYLASYQINPNTGTWALPSVEAQQQCLGWVAVNAPNGDVIEIGCDGTINIVCRRCMGGGPNEAYGEDQ